VLSPIGALLLLISRIQFSFSIFLPGQSRKHPCPENVFFLPAWKDPSNPAPPDPDPHHQNQYQYQYQITRTSNNG
jgi:hypothetical protein